MSLRWDYTKCATDDHVLAQAAAFACMGAGIGTIKDEDDAKVWFTRVSAWEKLHGAMRVRYNEDTESHESHYFSRQDARDLIGFTVNVSKKTDAAWRKDLIEAYAHEVSWSWSRSVDGAVAV